MSLLTRIELSILMRGIVLAGTAISLSGLFILPGLVQLLFHDKYPDVARSIQMIMLAAGLITPAGVFYHIALSRKREKRIFLGIVASTLLQLASNLIFIPLFGITGASMAMTVLTLTTLIVTAIVVQSAGLIQASFLRRLLVFLILSLSATLPLVVRPLPAWMTMAYLLLTTATAARIALFDAVERTYLIAALRTMLVRRKAVHHA